MARATLSAHAGDRYPRWGAPGGRGTVRPGAAHHPLCDLEEAIANANRLDVGLGASVWSSDSARAARIATRLQAGTVWVNQHGMVHPMVPFGGNKRSGWGLEFGQEGLKGVTQPQVISLKK
jgi:phenylacetaldehyde dehydrogenase